MSNSVFLSNANETEKKGAELARTIVAPSVIFLEGQLGAGKTTFVRGFLRGLGVTGFIKSPTFTLIETYSVKSGEVIHMDLYRLQDPAELELMGVRDYFSPGNIVLIEWAVNAISYLPKPSLVCKLTIPADGEGRLLLIE